MFPKNTYKCNKRWFRNPATPNVQLKYIVVDSNLKVIIMNNLNFYQINLNIYKDAQTNLMVELLFFKHKEYISLI